MINRRLLTKSCSLIHRKMSIFANVKLAPPDKILGLSEAFQKDTFPQKVNLGVGAYRTDEGKPYVLPSVEAAEARLSAAHLNKEYAPITGLPNFVARSLEFGYGMNSTAVAEKRIAATQSISGTGALRLAGEFIKKFLSPNGVSPTVYLPTPTWGNHNAIFTACGLQIGNYPYYNPATNAVDFNAFRDYLANLPTGSFVVLHACAHNPTGCDPTRDQWIELSALCKEKGLHVLFDSAYQGFASGNPETDAFSIRKFVEDGHSLMLCQSYAKNFGLYGERVGLFSVVCADADEATRVESQLKRLVRPMYSSPPIHGARIVAEILSDPELRNQWLSECAGMANRIHICRTELREKLEEGSGRSWAHITDQIGMFCFTGLTPAQVHRLRDEFHIYCTDDGRFSVAGINSKNIDYIAKSVLAVL